jgi:hypothetical protein
MSEPISVAELAARGIDARLTEIMERLLLTAGPFWLTLSMQERRALGDAPCCGGACECESGSCDRGDCDCQGNCPCSTT